MRFLLIGILSLSYLLCASSSCPQMLQRVGTTSLTSCMAPLFVPTVKSIEYGFRNRLPLFQVREPSHFGKISPNSFLQALDGIHSWNGYTIDCHHVDPQYPPMDGFKCREYDGSLKIYWENCLKGRAESVNILDAKLPEFARCALIPGLLRINTVKSSGCGVISPKNAFTPLHVDEEHGNGVYNGAWMYLLEGAKEWLFIHKDSIQTLCDHAGFSMKDLRALSIEDLEQSVALLPLEERKKFNWYRTVLKARTFMFFDGATYGHAVKTPQASLGLSEFIIPVTS